MNFGQPKQPMIFPEVIKLKYSSYLPKFAQRKRIKRPIKGMCRRCGQEFFTKKEFKSHTPSIGCKP